MKEMNLKTKTIICVLAFLVVFAVLLTLATKFDYQVSEILTKNALEAGEYHASDFYGVLLEMVGSTPLYLFVLFSLCTLFWFFLKVWTKSPLNKIAAAVCVFGALVGSFFIFKDAIAYTFDQVNRVTEYSYVSELDALRHTPAFYGLEVVLAIFAVIPTIFATKLFKEETLKKLFWFIVASGCAIALANILMLIIKDPVGRMRFRAINSDLGSSLISNGYVKGFTNWYVVNKQPDDAILDAFERMYGVEDAFKSFPSGHSSSAASVYCLIMIPSLFELKNPKLSKALCWILPIIFTMMVAISRIVVGAHYFSDVLFGGTLTFVSIILFREIFICKGSHFFAVFPKAKKN